MKYIYFLVLAVLSAEAFAVQISVPSNGEIECEPEKIEGVDMLLMPRFISIYSLIARPREYHMKVVDVTGVLRVGGTKIYLYINTKYMKNDVSSGALLVSWPKCLDDVMLKKLKSLNGKYARVVGVYNAEFHENFEAGAGLLVGTTSVSPNN